MDVFAEELEGGVGFGCWALGFWCGVDVGHEDFGIC